MSTAARTRVPRHPPARVISACPDLDKGWAGKKSMLLANGGGARGRLAVDARLRRRLGCAGAARPRGRGAGGLDIKPTFEPTPS
jgi:hypothetical protein